MNINEFENSAHASFLSCAIGKKDLHTTFKDETGYDIQVLLGRSRLDTLIDQATRREQELVYHFIVWATETYWNEPKDCKNIEVYMKAKSFLRNLKANK